MGCHGALSSVGRVEGASVILPAFLPVGIVQFIRAFPWIPWQNHSALLHEKANRCRRDKPLPIYISVRRLLASQAPNKQKSQEFVVLSFTSPKMAKRFVCDVHSCGMRFARFEEGLVGYCLFAFANPIVLVVITPGISILSDW